MNIFIVPAYNEEKNIGPLLTSIASLGYKFKEYKVIIVNDGSQDGTENIVRSFEKKMPIILINHRVNLGIGAVFNTGFEAALGISKPSDKVITMEADNTSDLAILPEMLKKASGAADVVLASCYARGGRIEGTNLWRKILSWGANLILLIAFPIKGVKTYSSFYRVYNAGFLQKAMDAYKGKLIEQPGFVSMVELIVKLSRMKAHITEVPMILKINNRIGTSKMRVWRTVLDYLIYIIKDLRNRLALKNLVPILKE